MRAGDSELPAGELPELGTHLITQRTGYTHHGIFVGDNSVIHYAGLARGLASGPVTQCGLEAFSNGQKLWFRIHPNARFTSSEIVERARSRISESSYCILSNNCEHFCLWCIYDEHCSEQVDIGSQALNLGMSVAGSAIAKSALSAAGAVKGLSASGIMSGLRSLSFSGSAAGGLVNGPLAVGTVAAFAIGRTLLRDRDGMSEHERESRRLGRFASHVGSFGAAAASISCVSAFGSVAGLSGAGVASGLAAVGSVVGGGMAAGTVLIMTAPAVAAVAAGYGSYKVAQALRPSEPGPNKRVIEGKEGAGGPASRVSD